MATLTCPDCNQIYTASRSDQQRCNDCRSEYRKRYLHDWEQARKTGECQACGGIVHKRSAYCFPCGRKAAGAKLGREKNPNWRGGITVDKAGYRYVRTAQIPGGPGTAYTAEHRLVYEENFGPIPNGYIIHHKNGVKFDNRPENLEALSREQHHSHEREAELREEIAELKARIKELE